MNKLTPFFKKVIEVRWSEFCKMEQEESHTSAEAVVFSIIRACVEAKLPAIKESLNRIDGKLEEQIEVIYPKFYITYPYATAIAGPANKVALEDGVLQIPEGDGFMTIGTDPEQPTASAPLITGSLRDTLTRMSEQPRNLVTAILAAAKDVEQRAAYAGEVDPVSDPLVKSVIVAGLLKMAHNGNLGAIFEVFDNIDGKLVDTIRILGEDVYLTSYDSIAPSGATKVDGVYRVEADNTTSKWAISLGKKGGDDGPDNR
jgi:hypothetical protein